MSEVEKNCGSCRWNCTHNLICAGCHMPEHSDWQAGVGVLEAQIAVLDAELVLTKKSVQETVNVYSGVGEPSAGILNERAEGGQR